MLLAKSHAWVESHSAYYKPTPMIIAVQCIVRWQITLIRLHIAIFLALILASASSLSLGLRISIEVTHPDLTLGLATTAVNFAGIQLDYEFLGIC